MWAAALFAAIGQAALVVGALLVWRFPQLKRPAAVGALMAFGAGAVISAVGTDLVAVAYAEAGAGPTALGIAAGAVGYYLIIIRLERSSQTDRAAVEPAGDEQDGSAVLVGSPAGELEVHDTGEVVAASPTEARNLFVGTIIDGIPESVAIGLSMHMSLVGFRSPWSARCSRRGLPEAIGVSAALFAGGYTLRKVLARFSIVVAVGALAGAIGFRVCWAPDRTWWR